MPRAQGARAQMALAFETAYGTPPAAGKYWRMPFASSGLGADQPLVNSELLGYGRDPLPPVLDAITADGDISVPIDLRFWGIWLKGAFGNPTTTGTTPGPYTHTFQSGAWTLPSMAIEIGNPEVPSYRMNKGVMVNSLSWSMARSGNVSATAALIAQGEVPATATGAGALKEMALKRFSAFNGSIKRGSNVLANVVSGSVTYSNNLDRVETIRPDGMIDGADPSVASLTGDVVVRFADTALLDQALDGSPISLTFGYEASPSQKFELTAHAVYLPKPRLTMDGPGGMQVTFSWQAAQDTTLGRMATAVLVNDVAQYNNPT